MTQTIVLIGLSLVVLAVIAALGRVSDADQESDDADDGEQAALSVVDAQVAVDGWGYVDRRTAGSRPTWAPVLTGPSELS